jgi:2-dehydro-3-deoxyphosphogluconate aldolase/(4S)-4-hydroxy-2-oxoglutarate aldolase
MSVFEELSRYGIVPVVAIDAADSALPLADALSEGGLPVAEITFRTEAARAAIEAIAGKRPDMLVGAGTVITLEQLESAKAAGARYALSPGIDADILARAAEIGLPFAPGLMTPSELQLALRNGCKVVKFFPAGAAGGPRMLESVAAPYAHTGIGFNPTGGVSLDNLADWLAIPQVAMVGGTWIATRQDIASKDWAGITAKARAAVELVAALRGGK